MSIRLLNAKRLAGELCRGEVSPRQRGYYLFASFALWLLINASGFTTVSPLWSWMSLVETAALLLVTLLGFSYAYDAAGGDRNPDFVAQFTCLYVPVSLTTVLCVWALYWGVVIGLRESIIAISDSSTPFAMSLGRAGSSLFDILVMVALLAVQAVIFHRITKLLRSVRSEHQAVGSRLHAGPASERA